MDDKTAKIPSLEQFKESRREREAQSLRSGSMQTKRQLQKKDEKSSKGLFGMKSNKKKSGKAKKQIKRQGEPRREDVNTTRRVSTHSDDERPVKRPHPSQQRDIRYSQVNGEHRRASSDKYSFEHFEQGGGSPQRAGRNTGSRDDRSRYYDHQGPRAEVRGQNTGNRRMPAPETYAKYRNEADKARRPQNGVPRRTDNNAHQRAKDAGRSNKILKKSKPRKPLSPAARKMRNIFAYTAIILVVLVIGAVLSLTVLFKTESITVSSNGKYTAQEIIDASGLVLGENIFTASKSRAASNIEKRYPAIEKADVYSVFPNSINIDITMAKPAYAIEALGGCYIISDKCKVLEIVSTADEMDVPVIEGLSVDGKTAGEYIEFDDEFVSGALEEMFSAFSEYADDKITAVNFAASVDGTASLKFVYDNRIVVYLGIPEHITYKVQTALTIITEKIDVNSARLAGDLDVSLCYDTNKSYFNQYSLISQPQNQNTAPTEPEDTTAATEAYY